MIRAAPQPANSIPLSHVHLVLSVLIIILLIIVIRALGINLSFTSRSKPFSGPFSEDVELGEDHADEESPPRPDATVREYRSSRIQKVAQHTLVVSIICIFAAPAVLCHCPEKVTVNISTKICLLILLPHYSQSAVKCKNTASQRNTSGYVSPQKVTRRCRDLKYPLLFLSFFHWQRLL